VVTTPGVQLTKPWEAALFGFRLDLQSRHRSEGTICNRLYSSTIMARHAIAAGLTDPAELDYPWLAQYMSAQYQARKRGGPCSLFANLRAFWTWYSDEFKSASPIPVPSRHLSKQVWPSNPPEPAGYS